MSQVPSDVPIIFVIFNRPQLIRMKVTLVSYSDMEGGAARATCRLNKGLNQLGVNSQMLVQVKSSDHHSVIGRRNVGVHQAINGLRSVAEGLPVKYYPNRDHVMYSTQWVPDRVMANINQIKPDIINLHWTNNGYLQIESIKKIQQPIVWTLHDMWAFTGGCHYSQECNRYTMNCGRCPQLNSQKSCDLSNHTWKRKARAWKNLNLTIVTPSRWLAQCARSSTLFNNSRVVVIPNGVDTEIYQPIQKRVARKILGLPQDKQLILSGSLNQTSDVRKGFKFLESSLKELSQSQWAEKVELVIFGASEPLITIDLGLKVHYFGTLSDDISLAILYAAADVFIAPSIQDNLPNTILESLACGTPCVAFNIGGMPDMIEHMKNGYLAKPYETNDFTHGIIWILESESRYQNLSHRSREKVVQEFTIHNQASHYLSLFEEILTLQDPLAHE